MKLEMFNKIKMLSKFFTLFSVVLTLLACAKSAVVQPENFYFKNVSVNGVQTGGFYANNLNLKPIIALRFSAPVSKTSASESIILTQKLSAVNIPVDITFDKSDSLISVTPKNNLSGISEYSLLIKGEMTSARNTLLVANINLGLTTGMDTTDKFPQISDEKLMDLVQSQTFKYFWDFGHPVSGLARERNTSGDICTSGGSGFGIMSMCVAVERNFITRKQGVERLTKIVNFLKDKTKTHHGAFPHWLNGETGDTIPFSTYDDGGDLVETSYLMQGLLTARQYFDGNDSDEIALRNKINEIWKAVEWSWYTQGDGNNLYWHWSPNFGWKMNMPIVGWNECLITYFLAASSPTFPTSNKQYENCWATGGHFKNGSTFYGISLPLGFDFGGPLFFSQYSFLGLDPRNLKDKYANYWQQNVAHSQINYKHCVINPKGYKGYGPNCWGLTASDSNTGYAAHSPSEDLGVISPTAALSAMPYMPEESKKAMRYFYYKLGDRIWKEYGFNDAFNLTNIWFASSYLAIDQGPIIVMIENYRTGLLWNKFMAAPEVKIGKQKLGFE